MEEKKNVYYQGNYLYSTLGHSDQNKKKKLVAEREQVLYMPKMHRFSSQAQMKTAGI